MAKILVVGCGDVGYRVALVMHERGHQVVALKRQPSDTQLPFPLVATDIRRPESLKTLSSDFDLVLFIVSPDSRQPEAYQALYETGLNNLLSHFSCHGRQPRWFMVSSTSVYGQNHGEWVDEASATQPGSSTSLCLRNAEQRLWEVDRQHCVVRFSGIYGPGRDWLIRRAAQGEAIQQQPPTYTNRIHRDDCVAVLVFLMEKHLAGDSLASCYLASDHDPAPLWEVMNWIAAQYHLPAPLPLSTSDNLNQNKRCSNARLVALGYPFLYPSYRDGYDKSYR